MVRDVTKRTVAPARRSAWSVLIAGLILAVSLPGFAAYANVQFKLDTSFGPTGLTTFGTVTVSQFQANPNEVKFDVVLDPSLKFHATSGGQHDMFGFNVPAGLTITGFTANSSTFTAGQITMLNPATSAGLTLDPGYSGSSVGTFSYGFKCGSPLCGAGFGGGFAGPFDFVITSATAITPSSFNISNGTGNPGYYAVVDLVNVGGTTGNVAANTTLNVPEPGGLTVIAVGLLGLLVHAARPFGSRRSASSLISSRARFAA